MKKLAILAMFAVALVVGAATVVPFSPKDGAEFRISPGGKLTRVEAFSPVSGGTVALKSVYSAPVYTNAMEVLAYTNVSYTVLWTNSFSHVVTTNIFPNLSFEGSPEVVGVTTNTVVGATTNMWPVLQRTVSVTNSIVSGTQTGYVFTNDLPRAVYLAPGERLIFTGTGVGGFVRLILE